MKITNDEADNYVLNVVANDYESLDTIRKEACTWAAEEGKSLSPDEATKSLIRLVRAGLVNRFSFDGSRSVFVLATVDDAPLEDHWYMISASGQARIG